MSGTKNPFPPIPPPGSTIQSLAQCCLALTECVQQLTGQRAKGNRAAQLPENFATLQSQIETINARLKKAGIA